MPLADLYRRLFLRLRGRGLGLGLFDRLHRALWEGGLQPDTVDVDGVRLRLPRRDAGLSDALRLGQPFEPETTAAWKGLLKPGMTALDVGANIGYYSLLAARLVGPSGRVHAVEPAPQNLALLRENVRLNGAAQVTVHACAAGDKPGSAELRFCAATPGSSSIVAAPEGEPVRVEVARADDLLGSAEVDAVKIDVEGLEPAVLDGMPRLLAASRLRALVVEANPSTLKAGGWTLDDLRGRLTARGFRIEPLDRGENWLCRR